MDENVENPAQNDQTPQEAPTPEPAAETEQQAPSAEGPSKDARLWATLCHIAAFAGLLGIPFGSILGPLILWLIKRADFPFVDQQGKEALNFQISITIYFIAAMPLLCGGPLVLLVWFPLGIVDIIFTIIAAINANNGQDYRYPICLRLVK